MASVSSSKSVLALPEISCVAATYDGEPSPASCRDPPMVSEDAAQSQSTLRGGVRRQAQPRKLGQQDGRFVSAIAHRKRACLEFGSCLPWNHFASSLLTILGIGPRLSTKWRQGWIGMGNVRPVGAPWRQPVPSLGKRWRDHKDPSFLSLPPAYGQSRAQATSSAPWSPMEIVVNIACDQSLKISLECLYGLTQFVHNNPVRNPVICDLQTVNQTDPDVASQKTPRLDPERPKLAEFHRSFGLSTWDMADSDCTVCSLAPVLRTWSRHCQGGGMSSGLPSGLA